ncbi:hypothetical protein [Macrococcus equipercicus]|nr:hypothetical protein [Macrococcus equipercicus]
MKLIKKIIITLTVIMALPQLIEISAEPINKETIAIKSAQSDD